MDRRYLYTPLYPTYEQFIAPLIAFNRNLGFESSCVRFTDIPPELRTQQLVNEIARLQAQAGPELNSFSLELNPVQGLSMTGSPRSAREEHKGAHSSPLYQELYPRSTH
ncbi:MAG: hypothetical protein V2I33_19310 [Kangiellaceae bacterium]|jgi:hypothetical protein|nr:hypothetical protein [Kangiellaceae bacterium]